MARLAAGVFGGTFDPVHVAHVALARAALRQLSLRTVLWVPAGDPWRKQNREITAARHRVAMVRLAIEGEDAFEVSLAEVERAGPSYSVDTLEELGGRFPGTELYLILGLDALLDLPNWRNPGRLLALARLAVAPRSEDRLNAPGLDALVPGLSRRVYWLEMPRMDVDATGIRERARRGDSLRGLVPPTVEEYIRDHRLYLPA